MGMSDAKNLSLIDILNRSPLKVLTSKCNDRKNSIASQEFASFFLSDNKNYVTECIYLFSLASRKLRQVKASARVMILFLIDSDSGFSFSGFLTFASMFPRPDSYFYIYFLL